MLGTSIIKIKFKGIDYYSGNRVSKVREMKVDRWFDDYHSKDTRLSSGVVLKGRLITAQEQADEYIGECNDFLNSIIHEPSSEWQCIQTWEILSIQQVGFAMGGSTKHFKEKTDAVKDGELIGRTHPSKGLLGVTVFEKKKVTEEDKIQAVFESIESDNFKLSQEFKDNFSAVYEKMKPSLKGLKTTKKIELVMSAMEVGYTAGSEAYNRINDIWKRFDKKRVPIDAPKSDSELFQELMNKK